MSAELLRKAATILRERALDATGAPWRWEQYRDDLPYLVGRGGDPGAIEWDEEVIEAEHHGECGCRSACHLELTVKREDRDYIATMHPGVGLALADWLDEEADMLSDWDPAIGPYCESGPSIALARLIVGGQP